MRTTTNTGMLEPLTTSNLELDDQREDIRDEKVYDVNGEDFGKVDEQFIDPVQRRTRFVSVKSGDFFGMGGRRYLIPVEMIKGQGERITIDETAERISEGPQIDDDFVQQGAVSTNEPDPIVTEAYRYYQVDVPFWQQGYDQPAWR